MPGTGTLEEAGKAAALIDKAGLTGLAERLGVAGIKAGARVPREADYDEMTVPELSGSNHRSSMLVPTAYKEAVELSLVPFMSNVGTYLQAKGFLGEDVEGEVNTSDSLALALDMALDLGNLATAGTSVLLNLSGRTARTVSLLTKAGKAGQTGAEVVEAAARTIEMAGKAAKAMPEVVEAAKLGDRAAVQSILKAALASGEMTEDATKLVQGLRGDASALARLIDSVGLRNADTPLAGLLRNAEGVASRGQLPPSAFLQATRAERLATGQVNPLLKFAQPANPLRHPGAFFRQVVGIEYDGDKFYAPGSRLYAEGLDKMLPKAGEDVAREVSFNVLRDEQRNFAGKLAEAEGRPVDAPSLWHSQTLMDRMELISGLQTDHVVSQITGEQVKDSQVDDVVRRLYGYAPNTKVTEEQRASMKALAVNAANGSREELDKLTLAAREQTFQTILTRKMKSFESMGMADTALAAADIADFRALHKSFNLAPIIADPQGVGSAIAARVSVGRNYASQQGFIARELIRAAYPNLHDADAVADGLGRFAEHLDLFEVRDGKLFLKADEEAVKKAAPLLHDTLWGTNDRRLLNSLTTNGLHEDVVGLVGQQRAFLDAVGPTLLHEGVIGGQINSYFPHVFQPNAKFFKTFKVDENTAGRFFEKLVISADTDGELATQILGAPLKGEFDGFMQAARSGKVSSQEARSLTEKMAVAFEKQGYGTYERDSLKVFAGYAAAANEALLVNRVIYDLPKSGAKLNRDALVAAVGERKADEIIARLGGEEALGKVDRFHLGMHTVPEELKEIFVPLTSAGRLGGGIAGLTSDTTAVAKGLAGAARSPESAAALERTLATREGRRAFANAVRKDLAKELGGKVEIGGVKVLDSKGKAVEINPDWIINNGGIPEKVQQKPALRAAWNRLIKERSTGERAESVALALEQEIAKRAEAQTAKPRTVYAFRGDAMPLIEALRMYPAEGHSAFASWYDTFNRNLKSVVLFGDFFYFNTLGVMQFVGAPETAMKTLLKDAQLIPSVLEGGFGKTFKTALIPGRNAALNALMGAVAGGVAGEALGADDAEQRTGFSLAGALYGAAIGSAIRGGRAARLQSVMGEHGIETLFWMGHGGWTGRPEDRAIGVLSNGLKKIYNKLAHETAGSASLQRSVVEGLMHAADAYESTLYGMLHNGGKTVLFQHYWASFLPKLEASQAFKDATAKGDEQAIFFLKKKLATEIVQATNNAMGGQRYAALFGNPTVERHLKRFLVSPDYTASRLSFTAAMLGNMGPIKGAAVGAGLGQLIELADAGFDMEEVQKRSGAGAAWGAAFGALGAHWQRNVIRRMGTEGDAYASIARRMSAAALIGGYVTYNLLNKELSGKWMHENEEGKRLSVQLPNGQYLTPGKPFTEAFHFAGVMDRERFPVPVLPFLANKTAPPIGIAHLIFNRGHYGQALFTAEQSPRDQIFKAAAIAIDSTTPIFLSQPLQSAGKAIMGGGGPTEEDVARMASDISGLAIRGRRGPTGRYSADTIRAVVGRQAALPALGDSTSLLEGAYR